MKIGGLRIPHPVTLAPLEEHSNYPFRMLMKQFGASLVCSERVDAADVARRQRPALRRLHTAPAEAPRAGQLSGRDPHVLAEAGRVVEELGFDIVDLNFDCPVRRLVDRGEGGALMSDPALIGQVVAAVVRAVSIPVTLKIRTGPDEVHQTAVEVARLAEQAGAAAVHLHARSVVQGYRGDAEWDAIARLKQAVELPVVASGGIRCAADAVRLLRQTGADAVGIGRGALGNPWIFREARAMVCGGAVPRPPTIAERGRALLQLVEGEFHLYGAPLALRRLPRTSGYFAQFLAEPALFREAVRLVRNLPQFRRTVREYFG